jgi:hypothetical protein
MKGFREDIAVDQDASFEFEELMNAAGHERAWVNLSCCATRVDMGRRDVSGSTRLLGHAARAVE